MKISFFTNQIRIFFYLLFLLLYSQKSSSLYGQNLEYGGGIGVLNYFGDLAPTINPVLFRPAIKGSFTYNFSNVSGIKANFVYGYVEADDAYYDAPFMHKRNLSFCSQLFEASAQYEYNFLAFKNGKKPWEYAPYVFFGMGMFAFQPKADFNDDWVTLHDIGSEGQGKDTVGKTYSRQVLCLPFGVGFKYSLSTNWNLTTELGIRKTFTDFLDDVSNEYYENNAFPPEQRAVIDRTRELDEFGEYKNPHDTQRGFFTNDDWYLLLSINITYVLYTAKCPGFMM